MKPLLRNSLCLWLLATVTVGESICGSILFSDTFVRYGAGHDIFRLFNAKFKKGADTLEPICKSLTAENRDFIGVSKPTDGRLTHAAPNPAFMTWYSKCIISIIDKELEEFYREDKALPLFLGGVAMVPDVKAGTWSGLGEARQKLVIGHLITRLIGPAEAVDQEPIMQSVYKALQASPNSLAVYGGVKETIFFITMTDEFLTY